MPDVQPARIAGARFVDPAVLARIGNLELVARAVVDGFINGLHRAPYFGASVDFAEHRGYVPGDDIRRVDWRLFGAHRPLLRQGVRGRHNTNFSVLLDVSKSMGFGSRGITKLDYAPHPRRVPDLPGRTGSATASASSPSTTTSSSYVPPSAKHMDVVLHTLDRLKPRTPGQPGAAAAASWPSTSGAAACWSLISDFYEEPEAVLDAIAPLRFRGNDLIVFHVLDPAEIEFSYDDASAFEDLESGEQIPVVPEALRRGVPRADPRAHRRAAHEVLRASGSTTRC